jgi:hypothetical protein
LNQQIFTAERIYEKILEREEDRIWSGKLERIFEKDSLVYKRNGRGERVRTENKDKEL